ncbi:hypothetical protein DPMN_089283 [Dreissena polymorpha]|uniref:Uncharacterized protein n=1 Tax=Dreissena polymorpha TaxID=45954 RepID=A0A9D4QXA6_DREPO|nr:hypothetical protein DPMN_089283 [Dreissena polymorpha]
MSLLSQRLCNHLRQGKIFPHVSKIRPRKLTCRHLVTPGKASTPGDQRHHLMRSSFRRVTRLRQPTLHQTKNRKWTQSGHHCVAQAVFTTLLVQSHLLTLL